MQRFRLVWLLLPYIPAVSHAAPSTGLTDTSWCSRGDGNTFEVFMLSSEHGKRVFREWLHARPGMSGSWRLRGDSISIRASEVAFSFQVVWVSPDKLVLATDNGETETYFKTRCAVGQDEFRP